MIEISRELRLLDNLCVVTRKKYHSFKIPKRNGTLREITAPSKELKELQKDFLKYITPHAETVLSDSVHGFRPERGVHTAVKSIKEFLKEKGEEAKSYVYLTADIENFFPSVRRKDVEHILDEIEPYDTKHRSHHAFMLTRNGKLPQGSPVSPTLANLKARGIDERMEKICKKFHGHYIRYADDIVILVKGISKERLKTLVLTEIQKEGWKAHPDKTKVKFVKAANGLEVLGNNIFLGINKVFSYNSKSYKNRLKRLRAQLKFLNTDKVVGYTKTKEGRSLPIYLSNVLLGYLAYFKSINTGFQYTKTHSGATWVSFDNKIKAVLDIEAYLGRVLRN